MLGYRANLASLSGCSSPWIHRQWTHHKNKNNHNMPTKLSQKIMFYVVYYQENIPLYIVYTSSVLYCFKDKLAKIVNLFGIFLCLQMVRSEVYSGIILRSCETMVLSASSRRQLEERATLCSINVESLEDLCP